MAPSIPASSARHDPIDFPRRRPIREVPKRDDADPDLLPCQEVEQWVTVFKPSFGGYADGTVEERFRAHRIELMGIDAYEPAGGLSWCMEYASIQSFVQKKFDALREAGILMFRSEFNAQEDLSSFRTLGVIFNANKGQKSGALHRLWGAEYLRKQLPPESGYRVPRMVIVLEDDTEQLPVRVNQAVEDLLLDQFDTRFGEILAEKIDGHPVGRDSMHREFLSRFGYCDFSDAGNILAGKNSRGQRGHYIVDTDYKALMPCLITRVSLHSPSYIAGFGYYPKERFEAFHPWLSKTVDVKISFTPNENSSKKGL